MLVFVSSFTRHRKVLMKALALDDDMPMKAEDFSSASEAYYTCNRVRNFSKELGTLCGRRQVVGPSSGGRNDCN
jgi:hypothetical protein